MGTVEKAGSHDIGLRLLNRRLGEFEPSLTARIRVLSSEQLEALGEALLDFSEVTH